MNGRERVLTALQHREPDRVPIDLGGMRSIGITVMAYSRLLDHLGIEGMAKIADPRRAIGSGGPSQGVTGARKGMKSRVRVFLLLIALLASGSGCGRSPYDLTLWVVDEDGSAIPKAQVVLGDDAENAYTTSETGEVMWTGLEESTIALMVRAERFLPKAVQFTLERGLNEIVVVLEVDPATWQSQGP